HKNISLNPHTGRLSGFAPQSPADTARLRQLLGDFGDRASAWLGELLPLYAPAWQRDRVSLRPGEEATRALRPPACNDLLHLDAFPNRPTHGARILRLFANINPSEPRVWATSDAFARLFARYGREVGLPGQRAWPSCLRQGLRNLFAPRQRGNYDSFMLRF